MRDVLRFLELLNERIPPIAPTRHGLGLNREDGRLTVSLSAFFPFFIDEEDLDKSPKQLVDDLAKIWNRMPQSKWTSFPDRPTPPPSPSGPRGL